MTAFMVRMTPTVSVMLWMVSYNCQSEVNAQYLLKAKQLRTRDQECLEMIF